VSGGDSVTITGTGFDPNTAAEVTFGGVPATNVLVENATTIRLTTPAHALGRVDVVVTQYGVPSTFTNAFTYVGPLSISSVSPDDGPTMGGTVLTITGVSFIPIEGTAATTWRDAIVMVGGARCNIVSAADFTDTRITCKTSTWDAETVNVTVSIGDNPRPEQAATLSNAFTYEDGYITLEWDDADDSFEIDGAVSADNTILSDFTSIGAATNSTRGHQLAISMAGSDRRLACTNNTGADFYLNPLSAGTALVPGQWGYSLNNTNWRAVPTSGSGAIVSETSTASELVVPIKVYFGAMFDKVTPACQYRGTVSWIASIKS
jgi:hypothetical protein